MSINTKFRTDKGRETDGVTIDYTDADGNVLCWFKCRRPGGRNTEYHKALNRLLRDNRQELQAMAEEEREELLSRINAEVYADAVILDWGGDIEGPDGNPAECTRDNILWLFTEDCPDLFESLQTRLSMRATWRPGEKEAALGNSVTASSTT